MSLGSTFAATLLAAAVTIHNIEEMIWLPGFPATGFARMRMGAATFRVAATVIALAFWLVALGLALGVGRLLPVLAGLATAMAINAVVPHLAMTLALRRYYPGAATAWLLVVPAAWIAIASAGGFSAFRDPAFAGIALASIVALAASLPAFAWLGGRVEGTPTREAPP